MFQDRSTTRGDYAYPLRFSTTRGSERMQISDPRLSPSGSPDIAPKILQALDANTDRDPVIGVYDRTDTERTNPGLNTPNAMVILFRSHHS